MLAQAKPATCRAALEWAARYLNDHNVTMPRLDADLLLAAALQTERINLYLEPLRELAEGDWEIFKALVERRGEREPLQYILGKQEFMTLELAVSPDVLIPRADTEVLVEAALNWAASQSGRLNLLDLCTGSGAIAISLAHFLPQADVWAGDVSAAALEVARHNAERCTVNINFALGDLTDPFAGQKFHLITANPPYIPSREIATLQPEVALREPRLALDGGEDGLDFYRRLAVELPEVLLPGALILLEIGWDQGESVPKLFHVSGYEDIQLLKDLGGRDRVLAAVWRR
ncbi:MAG: peptide chain release factor N(5)-glutamine methyltransferase [Peptococcaceae bacterium]|nr:peptide chain release factor N(5)-glutamine methyltransferase [Peptococcaceae bacterium]